MGFDHGPPTEQHHEGICRCCLLHHCPGCPPARGRCPGSLHSICQRPSSRCPCPPRSSRRTCGPPCCPSCCPCRPPRSPPRCSCCPPCCPPCPRCTPCCAPCCPRGPPCCPPRCCPPCCCSPRCCACPCPSRLPCPQAQLRRR